MLAYITTFFAGNFGKAIYLIIVVAAAMIVSHLLKRVIARSLERFENLPNATIFVNVMRGVVWVAAASLVMKPVFGVDATVLAGTLGVGGIALTLGLQDTISNFIGGMFLILGRVINKGDYISINSITGTIIDITWRQTVVVDRIGQTLLVPNSVMNSTALQIMPEGLETFGSIPFTASTTFNEKEISTDIIASVEEALGDSLFPGSKVEIRYKGFNEYGICGEVWYNIKHDASLTISATKAARALYGKPYLVIVTPA